MKSVWSGRGILRRLRRRGEEDRGVAMVIVVGTMMVLASLTLVALGYAMAGQKFARYDQDYSAAMSAAQSGVDDFISRLNRSEQYGVEVDCANAAWQGPMDASTNLCGWTSTTTAGWLPVTPGDDDARGAYFHYAVDASEKPSTGMVKLVVTGRVDDVYRTIETSVGKDGSTDYVYYTDFEDADPDNKQAYPSGAPNAGCGRTGYQNANHWYQGRSGCNEITFIGTDTLDGSVFTNDTVLSSGANFLKSFETATPNCATATADHSTWNGVCLRSGSTANFSQQPSYEQPLYLPDNSATFETAPGCHYFGSTRVIFDGSGTMTVWNTRADNGTNPSLPDAGQAGAPLAITPPGGTAPNCGDLTHLNTGQTLPVPDGMVIYTAMSTAANQRCFQNQIGGPSGQELPLGTYDQVNTVAPTASGQTYTYDLNMAETTKYCNQGNLYAEGVIKGRVTLAAQQSVIVTGDLVLAGGVNGTDILGVVATSTVEVFHPRMVTVSSVQSGSNCNHGVCTYTYQWNTNNPNEGEAGSSPYTAEGTWPHRWKASTESGYTPTTGVQVQGSIQTLQHSFVVQKYDSGGNKGTLMVYGSIAQRWRGIVGQSGGANGTPLNGYSKLYKYDTRLVYTRPPYFPTWVNSKWSQRYSGEITTPGDVKS